MRQRLIFIGILCMISAFSVRAEDNYIEQEYDDMGSAFVTDNPPLKPSIKPRGEKLIIFDPNEHMWGAYNERGKLVHWGLATAGADWCPDMGENCHTESGHFRIFSLGDMDCISHTFPIPDGGAPMPYCMYFNGGQAIHGSDEVQYANLSHGCIRVTVDDARWLRYHFVERPNSENHYRGTEVIIKPYETY